MIWYITALNTKIIVESWNFIPFPTYPMAILGAARCSNTVRVSIRSPMALEMAKLALKTWNHKWSHNGTWYSDRVSSSLLSSPWRPGSCGDGWTYLSIHCCPWKLGDQWMNNGWIMDEWWMMMMIHGKWWIYLHLGLKMTSLNMCPPGTSTWGWSMICGWKGVSESGSSPSSSSSSIIIIIFTSSCPDRSCSFIFRASTISMGYPLTIKLAMDNPPFIDVFSPATNINFMVDFPLPCLIIGGYIIFNPLYPYDGWYIPTIFHCIPISFQ